MLKRSIMSSQLHKCWIQLALGRRYSRHALHRKLVCEQGFSSHCALPVSRIEENETVPIADEFDEGYTHAYPTDVSQHARASINEIMQEIEVCSRFHFHPVPKHLSPSDWAELLNLETRKARERFYKFMYWKEKHRDLKRKKAKDKRVLRGIDDNEEKNDVRVKYSTNDVIPYKPNKNSLFGCLSTLDLMERIENLKVMKSAIFGPHIIIDCSYEFHMGDSELTSCVRQLAMVRKSNRRFREPFNVIHCNFDVNGLLVEKLKNFIPDALDPANTFNYTEKSFLDLFPREKLIYLSPHSDIELETYDNDAVYIIGALVDHVPKIGLSTERAEVNGIKTVKFPLEKYANWCKGSKCLMLFQAVQIMNDLREGVSWKDTLERHIQFTKTTFSGVYWRGSSSEVEPLSTKYIDNWNYAAHITRKN